MYGNDPFGSKTYSEADSSGGVTTFEYDASGTLTLGGFADVEANTFRAQGGVSLIGSFDVVPYYIYEASGGIRLGSSATVRFTQRHISSGKLTIGSEADIVLVYYYTSTGGLRLDSSADVFSTSANGTGNMVLAGSASVSPTYLYEASGGFNIVNAAGYLQLFRHVSSGNLALNGVFDTFTVYLYDASGTLTLNDTADVTSTALIGSGTITLSGSVDVFITYLYEASGTLSLGFTSPVRLTQVYFPSGTLRIGDSIELTPTYIYESTGSLTLNGTVDVGPTYLYEASGGLSFSDSAFVQRNFAYTASEGLSLGSSADVILILDFKSYGGSISGDSICEVPVSGSDYAVFVYTASGGLNISGEALYKPVFSVVGEGTLTLGPNTADIFVLYIYDSTGTLRLDGIQELTSYVSYEASGGLSLRGTATVGHVYVATYIASGSLKLVNRSMNDFEKQPSDYWFHIEDRILKDVQSRNVCTQGWRVAETVLSNEGFLGALRNENVREAITASQEWRIVCYYGRGNYELEIDGRRLNVNVVSSILPRFTAPTINVTVSRETRDQKITIDPTLQKGYILANVVTGKTKEVLIADADWQITSIKDNIINIVLSTGLKITVPL